MQGDNRAGILGGLAAYIIVYLADMQNEGLGQNFAIIARWFLLIGVITYAAKNYPQTDFRSHTRSPFKSAVIFWIVFFLLYSIKPGITYLAINNGLQGITLFMLMHLIISFVLMLIITFAVRTWSTK